MTAPYTVGKGKDPRTGRMRWAVLDGHGAVHIPTQRGRDRAEYLCRRLNSGKVTANKRAVVSFLENDGRYFTQDETADIFGVTGERIRQIVVEFGIERPFKGYTEAMQEIRRLKNINSNEATE